MLASRLSRKGQVTIPKAVREKLGARPGDVLLYEVRGSSMTLRRLEPFDADFHAAVSQTLGEWSSPKDDEAFRNLDARDVVG